MIKLYFDGISIQLEPYRYTDLVPMLRSVNRYLYYKDKEVLDIYDNGDTVTIYYIYGSDSVSLDEFLENTTMYNEELLE